MSGSPMRVTTLPSGLRVASEVMPHVETATLGAWVDAGTRHEPAAVNGVAHLLEHMAFKGTRRRDARAIAEEIEAVGGSLNAYTSREQTAYYARILAGDVALAADIIADILQDSVFDEAELAKERNVVLQEIGLVEDTPDDLVFDLLQEAAYPGQPIGRSILGPEAIVAAMPRRALTDYIGAHYTPARIVLAGSGKVEHEQLVELAGRCFDRLPAASAPEPEPARFAPGTRIERRADLEQVHVCVAVEGVAHDDPDFFALQVLSSALGGGMSSRLFQEARENRGLCYAISTFTASYVDTGLLGIYAGTSAGQVPELTRVIAGETAALVAAPDAAEIGRARAQLKAGVLMALESCYAVCEDLARQLQCLNRRVPTDEVIARIEAVDVQAVRRVGERLLAGKPFARAAVGPLRKLPELRLGG